MIKQFMWLELPVLRLCVVCCVLIYSWSAWICTELVPFILQSELKLLDFMFQSLVVMSCIIISSNVFPSPYEFRGYFLCYIPGKIVSFQWYSCRHLLARYRQQCAESEVAAQELQCVLNANSRLSQYQKTTFTAAPLHEVQKGKYMCSTAYTTISLVYLVPLAPSKKRRRLTDWTLNFNRNY